jgi:hypothetical protein
MNLSMSAWVTGTWTPQTEIVPFSALYSDVMCLVGVLSFMYELHSNDLTILTWLLISLHRFEISSNFYFFVLK